MKKSTLVTAGVLSATALIAFFAGRRAPARPVTRRSRPERSSRPAPPVEQTYEDSVLRLKVEKPKSRDWAMTSDYNQFHAPVRHPAKVLEMRRQPQGPGDRFALVELYVVDVAAGADTAREVAKLERQGMRGKLGKLRVLEEGAVTVGQKAMTRRVTLWDARGSRPARENPLAAQTTLLSLRMVVGGKLYVLMAAMPAKHYQALLPELEQAFQSIEIG